MNKLKIRIIYREDCIKPSKNRYITKPEFWGIKKTISYLMSYVNEDQGLTYKIKMIYE